MSQSGSPKPWFDLGRENFIYALGWEEIRTVLIVSSDLLTHLIFSMAVGPMKPNLQVWSMVKVGGSTDSFGFRVFPHGHQRHSTAMERA